MAKIQEDYEEYENLYPSHEREYQSNYNRKYYIEHAYQKSKNNITRKLLNNNYVVVKQSSIDKYELDMLAINIIRTEKGYPKAIVD